MKGTIEAGLVIGSNTWYRMLSYLRQVSLDQELPTYRDLCVLIVNLNYHTLKTCNNQKAGCTCVTELLPTLHIRAGKKH